MASTKHFPPGQMVAGDTESYIRSLADYPASAGWGYTIYFAGPVNFNVASTPSGDDFPVTIAATVTAALAAGNYPFIERVKKGSEEHTVGTGVLDLLPNLAATGIDARTHEEKTLAVIEAALSGRLTSDIQSYQIAGRAVSKIPIAELMKMKGYYRAIIHRTKTGDIGRDVQVTFGNPDTAGDVSGFPGMPGYPWRS